MTELPTISGWQDASLLSRVRTTPTGVVLRLDLPDRVDHLPGQHYVVRLTAPDGYTAQRSYSVASPPSDTGLELYVEGLPDGEVSGYLTEVAEIGDPLEVRGPIGGWFVWTGETPALGLAGGSGVVPLVAMMRHAIDLGRPDLLRLAVSARTIGELPYATELLEYGATVLTTREPAPSGRPAARLAAADLAPLLQPDQVIYVCGSAGFAETASNALMSLDVDPGQVRLERFGPTG